MNEIDKHEKGLLAFIRTLLVDIIGAKQAKQLSDDKIAWIAPLVEHEFGKLDPTEVNITMLRYGFNGCKPLSYKQIIEAMDASGTLTRGQAIKAVERTTKAMISAINSKNDDERNLYMLLSGNRATAVLSGDWREDTRQIGRVIGALNFMQHKFLIWKFIDKYANRGKE